MNMETTNLTEARMKKYLKEGKRFDGRKFDEFRDISIKTNVSLNAEGSARVKVGKTEVIAGVKMSVGEPYPDSGNKGNLMTMAEILPLSSQRIESGRPGFDSIELGRVIDRGLRESGYVDFEKLCIKENEKVWTINVDIFSINDDGNLMDAAGIAAVAALRTTEIPKYDDENDKVLYGESSGEKLPLSENSPFLVTFYKIGEEIIVDPTREEEDIIETRIIVGLLDGYVASMQKSAEESLTIEQMNKVLDLSDKLCNEISPKLKKQMS